MNYIAAVEDVVQTNIFLFNIDFVDRSVIGELARWSVAKISIIVQLLRFNCHSCYVSITNTLFRAHRCPLCDQFIKRTYVLEQRVITCKERIEHVFPKKVYQLRETLFDKLVLFKIPYPDNQELFENIATFDCESICVQEDKLRNTETGTWIGEHVPISVSISSILIEQPTFLCNSNRGAVVGYFLLMLSMA